MSEPKPRLLFVCTANISRSRTAEDLFAGNSSYEVKSAGFIMLDQRSGQLLTQELVDWADKIFIMCDVVDHHWSRLRANFNVAGKEVWLMNIRNRYERGDSELIRIFKTKLAELRIRV